MTRQAAALDDSTAAAFLYIVYMAFSGKNHFSNRWYCAMLKDNTLSNLEGNHHETTY